MSELEKLKKTTSLSELATLLGYKPKALSYILYKFPGGKKYREFTIPKKNGGERRIKAPADELKHLQRRLSDLLNECFEEICNKNKLQKSLSHGFRKKHSIITNAIKHKNKRYVFNIDLQDFFPSINFGRVRGFLIKNRYFNLNEKVATVIAQIACHDNELPQGSPCSPIISNLIGHLLDIRMVNLANKTKCTYSRYADDLTFSTNKKDFPQKIALKKIENEWIVGDVLRKEVEKVGFSINNKKTSMQFKTARQMTTGLIVNKKVNIKKEYYKKARSMCYTLFKTDEFYTGINQISSETSLNESESNNKIKGTLNQLEGILSFVYQVKRPHDKNTIKKRRFHPTAITKLYRNFLFYKNFFSIDKPLIICEGKSDIIYLKCALRQLKNNYKELIQENDDDISFKIRFLNMSKNLRDVFAISTGTSGLASLMDIYEKNIKMFGGKGKKHPVIMLVDNDIGSKEIKKRLEIKEFMDSYYNFFENLYVIFAPEIEGEEIEDLFDKKTLETEVDGKIFSREKKIDNKKEYGKIVFAKKVIEEKENEINFDDFKLVFNKFKKVIEDYSSKNA